MKKILLFTVISLLLMFFINLKAKAEELTPSATSSILIEASTGEILYEKNIHQKLAPASMTKIMTMLLVIENIENGTIKYSDKVRISKNASSMGGSQLFIQEGDIITVKELLQGSGIASANDASVALAEYVGGTKENFVSLMNKRAKELGAKNTSFKNPCGLDEEGHLTTAYDLSLMAKELVKHKDILKITKTYESYMNKPNGEKFWLVNTNKLIRFYEGMDGLKTGFTNEAGYGITATAIKNNMRLISVVMKSSTSEQRTQDTIKLMEYGYSMFNAKTILSNNKKLGNISISNSEDRIYPYYVEDDVKEIIKKGEKYKKYKYNIKLDNKIAPITKREKIGTLTINYKDEKKHYNIITNKNVKKANYFKTFTNNLKDIISGSLNIL